MLELNKLYNMDCMEGMKQFPDKYFELAIVDPPYGIARFGNRVELSNRICQGDKILDTHAGSCSSLIACHNYKFEYIGFEIDKDYYEAAQKRMDAVMAQISMF